jgi:LPXTG-motif cell wall-anchored protein
MLVKGTDYTVTLATDDTTGAQSFRLKFLQPNPIKTAYILNYQSVIASVGNDRTVSNKIVLQGNNVKTVSVEKNQTYTVGITSGMGTIDGVNGSLTVTKVDQNNPSVKLKDAVFSLYRKVGNNEYLVNTLSTGQDGTLLFKNLKSGSYVLKEITAPYGYELAPSVSYPLMVTSQKPNVEQLVPNKPISGSITVKKVGAANPAAALNGAVFELKAADGSTVGTGTTDVSGSYTFSNLPLGSYTLKETGAPSGYQLDATARNISLTLADKDAVVTVSNTPFGSITVKKVDEANPATVLEGATFALYAMNGSLRTLAGTLKTGASGIVAFQNLPLGDYVLVETESPTGYRLDPTEHAVKLTLAAKDIEQTLTNQKNPFIPIPLGSITLKKVDAVDGKLLDGATFALYAVNGGTRSLVAEHSTNTSGQIVFDNLLLGTYVVKEIVAPAGYDLNPSELTFTLDENNLSPSKTVTNRKTPSSPSPSPSPSPSATPTSSPSLSPSATPSPSGTATPTPSASGTPSSSATPAASTTPQSTPQSTPGKTTETTKEDTPVSGKVDVPRGGTASPDKSPEHGTVQVNPDGSWVYTPNRGYTGKDQLTIIVKDKNGQEHEVYIDIQVDKIPLGTTNGGSGSKGPTQLPKTGEDSYLLLQLTGLGLFLTGTLLARRWRKHE